MKSRYTLLSFLFLLAFIQASRAEPLLHQPAVTGGSQPASPSGNFSLGVVQSTWRNIGGGFMANVNSSGVILPTLTITTSYVWFAVDAYTNLDNTYISGHQPFAGFWANRVTTHSDFQMPENSPFYIGVAYDIGNAGSPYAKDFGWAKLIRSGTDVSVLDSAMYTDSGIVVGTTSTVPEPSSLSLLALGVVVMLGRKKRQ
jgi:PEP-CTERM motif